MLLTYLSFNGNCREAMLFYQQCFGGKLSLQTLGGSAFGKKFPKTLQPLILHANLVHNSFVLMASDIHEGAAVNASVQLHCKSRDELHRYHKKLSQHCNQSMPIQTNHWGILIGNIIDKYKNCWMLSYGKFLEKDSVW